MLRVILSALVILLVLTACSPAALPPAATATYTATRPPPTATVTPTLIETPPLESIQIDRDGWLSELVQTWEIRDDGSLWADWYGDGELIELANKNLETGEWVFTDFHFQLAFEYHPTDYMMGEPIYTREQAIEIMLKYGSKDPNYRSEEQAIKKELAYQLRHTVIPHPRMGIKVFDFNNFQMEIPVYPTDYYGNCYNMWYDNRLPVIDPVSGEEKWVDSMLFTMDRINDGTSLLVFFGPNSEPTHLLLDKNYLDPCTWTSLNECGTFCTLK